MKQEPIILHVVCDYSPNGLEFGEISSRLQYMLQNPHSVRIHPTSIPALSTIALGFVTQQYAFAPHRGRAIIYGNAAPRREKSKAIENNVGQGIKYARLDNGVEIINVWSEYAFGFVKDHIVEFRDIDCPTGGSQFRSRDLFPERVAKIIDGERSILTDELDINDIPDVPKNQVVWTDWFGNIKTSMRLSDLKDMGFEPGDKAKVTLNGVTKEGVVAIGGFTVDKGTMAINVGSSGYDDPFVEFFLRVHSTQEKSAAATFNHPDAGAEFKIEAIK